MTHPPQTDAQFVARIAKLDPIGFDEIYGSIARYIALSPFDRDRLVLLAAQPTCATCRYFDRDSVAWCMKGVHVPVNVYIGVPSFGCTLHQPVAPAPERP